MKGKIGIVIKMKGCKTCDDSKSNIKTLFNNHIVYTSELKSKLQSYQLLTSWWLGSEMGKFNSRLDSYGIASENDRFYLNL